MKNNLIVAGVPRAGKSTLSRLLARTYGYQHVSMDSIIAGIEACFPETGISTHADLPPADRLRLISGRMAPFIRAMLDSGEYDEFSPGMVLDVYQLLPEDFAKHIRGANCAVVYLITPDVTPEERFAILKRYDTEKDYTFGRPDGKLRKDAEILVEQSLLMRDQCRRLGIPFAATARDREEVLRRLLRTLPFSI